MLLPVFALSVACVHAVCCQCSRCLLPVFTLSAACVHAICCLCSRRLLPVLTLSVACAPVLLPVFTLSVACVQDHRREDGQRRLQTMKSMLRLVAARGLPDGPPTTTTTTTVRRCSKRVVPLPLLQLDPQRNASSSEDFVALRDARRTLRHMFFPPHSVSRRATAVWNYRFDSGGRAPHSRQYRGGGADSSDASFQVLPPVGVPACSPADDRSCPTESATTFDADRVDSEQFEYVFERFSLSSTESTTGTSLSPESDTGTYSARAQRPSTTDTVATPQRQIETRASLAPPLSPLSTLSPRQRARGGESWPPQFTVVPSWPSVDDPYRFQYFGCGVHRDIMRRLHKSRGRRRASRQSQPQPQPQPQPEPQKLEVVVPSHTDCDVCNTADECRHSLRQRPNTGHQSHAASLTAKSAKSRDSLPMSVCTVLSRPPHQRLPNGRVPNDKEPAQVAAHVEGSSSDSGQCEGFQHKGELLNTAHSHVTRRKRMPSGRGVSDVGTRREAVPLSKGQADVAHWKERAV